MFYKRIFANKKTGLRFAAMGNCQLEFFERDGVPFFTATIFQGRQLQKIELDLAAISVATLGEHGYQLVTRHTTCKFQILEDKGAFRGVLTQKFLHWLPYKRFKGRISRQGVGVIRDGFAPFINSEAY
ncbi:MAG: hypothetical protein M1440_12925 [Gammaproteobacteria bacterium]|nr:hypothetical protein [Gammaproteobacteria bacterium]